MASIPNASIDAGKIIKVNHAGEHGAVNLCAGQIAMARWRARALAPELADFKRHEERHRAIFAAELKRRGLARCRSYWLCGAVGYMLGLLTGAMGATSIASATVAVERVVLRHLRQQLQAIGIDDAHATAAISAILCEEQQHHDQSAARLGHAGVIHRILAAIIAAATEAVIWTGMRI